MSFLLYMVERYYSQSDFEQVINILIMYKQENNDKTVYLSEKSLKEAVEWFKNKMLKDIKQ